MVGLGAFMVARGWGDSPNPGFRRGEGGWVLGLGAFRRCWRMTLLIEEG